MVLFTDFDKIRCESEDHKLGDVAYFALQPMVINMQKFLPGDMIAGTSLGRMERWVRSGLVKKLVAMETATTKPKAEKAVAIPGVDYDYHSVTGLNFPTQIARALQAAGIDTVDLLACYQDDFAKIKGIGKASAAIIKAKLSSMGLIDVK